VYGTLHANNIRETINRLTQPPIGLPKQILSALSLIVVQHIDRRNGKRRTLQIGEVVHDGNAKPIMQLNIVKDTLEKISDPTVIFETLKLYIGLSKEDVEKDISEKIGILKWMVRNNITDINKIGIIMSRYYRKQSFKDVT
jgi:flagellar protein FlaI